MEAQGGEASCLRLLAQSKACGGDRFLTITLWHPWGRLPSSSRPSSHLPRATPVSQRAAEKRGRDACKAPSSVRRRCQQSRWLLAGLFPPLLSGAV